MDPHGATAQRFPLVARFRPACLPLPERVAALLDLAQAALAARDQGLASAVFNQAALLASDLDIPELARRMCHAHAHAYLDAGPLPAMSAIRGLEPIVNLARLQIRAGNRDDGRHRLETLYRAIDTATATEFEGIAIPADLIANDDDRNEVRAWLWRVLLADGTRTLTTSGQWLGALAHIEHHRGIGQRMLDGRQVAIIAALTTGALSQTTDLIATTQPGDPWEQLVTACLGAIARQSLREPIDKPIGNLVGQYESHPPGHGTTVFEIRLGLTILDLAKHTDDDNARRVVDDLYHRATAATDGYAARECLEHPAFRNSVPAQYAAVLRDLVDACALGTGSLTTELADALTSALESSHTVIRDSLHRSGPTYAPTPSSRINPAVRELPTPIEQRF